MASYNLGGPHRSEDENKIAAWPRTVLELKVNEGNFLARD